MKNKEFEYPMWFKSTKSGLVVRFDSRKSGKVVVGSKTSSLGEYSKEWIDHQNSEQWIDVTDQYKEKTEIPPLKLCKTPNTNKYKRKVPSLTIDVYDVLKAFNVVNPATQHAIKKLLCAGGRGHKDKLQDLKEALQSIERAIELEDE